MPTPVIKPTTIVEPFALNGQKNVIPTTTATPGAASLDQGFPALTMTPVQQGGVPPSGRDFNGILNLITQHIVWANAGCRYTFDAALAAFIGGYPVGAVLQSDDGASSYVNMSANNSANFNTDPSQIGVTWMPFGGAAVNPSNTTTIATTGGTTVLTGKQAASGVIKVTGTLVSNANVIFPAGMSRPWTIINATSGAFTVNVAPSGGTSVSVAQSTRNIVISDGAVMSYAQTDAPTQTAGDNSTRIANTAFVGSAIATAIAAALINTVLTGTPTAPTRPPNDNSTKLATTAYTDAAVATLSALVAGSSPAYYTANFTAGPTGDFWVNTSAGPFTLTLPDPPNGANPIRVQDVSATWGMNALTINPGTKTILGDTSLICDRSGEAIELWYDGSTWRVV
jgi:hypothetical protein